MQASVHKTEGLRKRRGDRGSCRNRHGLSSIQAVQSCPRVPSRPRAPWAWAGGRRLGRAGLRAVTHGAGPPRGLSVLLLTSGPGARPLLPGFRRAGAGMYSHPTAPGGGDPGGISKGDWPALRGELQQDDSHLIPFPLEGEMQGGGGGGRSTQLPVRPVPQCRHPGPAREWQTAPVVPETLPEASWEQQALLSTCSELFRGDRVGAGRGGAEPGSG